MVETLLAKGADVEAKMNIVSQDVEAKTNVSIARACALCPSRSLALTDLHACNMCMATSRDVPVCTPLLLPLETALQLQGLSAIATTRLGQSGSGPQRDTGHYKSLQRVRDVGADLSPSHILADVTEARDALSRHCYRGWPTA